VPFGGSGASCFPVTEPPTARCSGALRCSEGGAADGTALCVPVVATDGTCDPRGFSNICAVGVTCVTDPAPPKGMKARAQCTLAGARRAAPCREAAPRCDSPFACSAADPPTCVAVVPLGLGCDPMGEGDRCAPGLTCSPLGDGGAAICH
jgi:hypothetical protein